jgi:phage FluMu protein Com
MTKKETYINTLVNSMNMEDLKQYVENDMADFLSNCSESEVINEFLIKVEHTTDQQFYNKFVKKIKW